MDSKSKSVALMRQTVSGKSELTPFGSSLMETPWNGRPSLVSESAGIEKHGTPSTSVILDVPIHDVHVEES